MQCVKLRSVMGSYLNIHLSLFPIYVLLLLLTLSHGRPSAKVRETRLLKSPQQEFRERISSPPSFSPSLVNSVAVSNKEYISVVNGNSQWPLSHLQEQQVSPAVVVPTILPPAYDSAEEKEAVVAEEATSSISSATTQLSPSSSSSLGDLQESVESNVYEQEDDDSDDEIEELLDDEVVSYSVASNEYDEAINASSLRVKRAVSNLIKEPESNNLILHDEEEEEPSDQFGSQHELGQYRQSILNSLGHYHGNFVDVSNSDRSINQSHMDTITKYNITKEEYLEAYTEYMRNVKKRREANRGLIGVKDRRKKAVTIAKTYHDNGTDLFSIGSKVLRLFRFDIQYTPRMEGTDVRIQRVVLNLPAVCQLTGHVRNSTNDLPDFTELSQLAQADNGEEDCANGTGMTQIDLTRNVTSWSVRSRTSSPFIVMAICARDSHESSSSSTTASPTSSQAEKQQHHHRHGNHHGSSLKMVTKEFMKPSYQAQVKRRQRRAASSEPSTLLSFNHKRDTGKGRECANTRHGKTCCRRSLKMRFSELGISDVILEPQEFDAHVCDGRCNARRVPYASTHAMFQHILHQTKGKKFAPRPCCVPTALSELDVLHVDPNGNRNGGPKLIVTILKDAIVKECGCS